MVIIAIEAKVGISTNFSIVKALVVRIISASIMVIKAGSPPVMAAVIT